MYTLEKFQRTGNGFKERLIIKGFRTSDAMYKFLCAQDNNNWKESKRGFKPGTYAMAGGEWQNTKRLDPFLLAHI